jgi:hypothetical protein
VERALLQTTDWEMEEINWRVIDNRLKNQPMSAYDALVLQIERGKHRDKLCASTTKLMNSVPELIDEDKHCTAGIHKEPEEEKKPRIPEGVARLMKQKEDRKEEIAVATYPNWGISDSNTVERVLAENWERAEVGGELWMQCEELCELILGDLMPKWADDDRKRMQENSEATAARGDWHMDSGTTYHRKIKKRPNSKCSVPVEDVELYFRGV